MKLIQLKCVTCQLLMGLVLLTLVEGLYTPNFELLFVDGSPCMQHELRRLTDFSSISDVFNPAKSACSNNDLLQPPRHQ